MSDIKNNIPKVNIIDVNCKDLTSAINTSSLKLGGYTRNAQRNGQRVVQFYNPEDRHKLMDTLKNNNVQYYTYTPKNENSHSLVLRGLDHSFSDTEIADALNALGFNVNILSVGQLRTVNAHSTLWSVTFSYDSDINSIFNLRYLLYHKISFETRRKSNITQCYRCQRFGHSSTICNLDPNCVRCAGQHLTQDCTLTKINTTYIDNVGKPQQKLESKVKCSNCAELTKPITKSVLP